MKLPLTVKAKPGATGGNDLVNLIDATGTLIANNLLPSECEQIARAVNREQALVDALELAANRLNYVASIFNHPMFTDRGQDGPACKRTEEVCRAALNLYKEGK